MDLLPSQNTATVMIRMTVMYEKQFGCCCIHTPKTPMPTTLCLPQISLDYYRYH